MAQTKSYNRLMAGNRLYERRKQLGWSRGYVSEKVGKVEKYYADIERGSCGMSIKSREKNAIGEESKQNPA